LVATTDCTGNVKIDLKLARLLSIRAFRRLLQKITHMTIKVEPAQVVVNISAEDSRWIVLPVDRLRTGAASLGSEPMRKYPRLTWKPTATAATRARSRRDQ